MHSFFTGVVSKELYHKFKKSIANRQLSLRQAATILTGIASVPLTHLV
jgi:hypothetical protein